jgi:myo-inositol 2-dehydrogenase / D-chiro-inositol 1-dehydrogenase
MIPTNSGVQMKLKTRRRDFLKTSSAVAAGLTFLKPTSVFGSSANSAVQLGIIGCGGRGTHVASSFMNNTTARVVAIAELFDDRLEEGKKHFHELSNQKQYPLLKASNCFLGSKAHLKLLDSKEVDAVLIATPPFLHPAHLRATVEAGKHVYCEKPVAVDVHGCQQVIWAGQKAGDRLSLAVGFQIRHASPYVEMVRRIHDGAIGEIVLGQAYYFTGALNLPALPKATSEELRLRHWVHDRVLSGDILVEQGIHVVDICNWVMKGHPIKATGYGGRKGRGDLGNCWGHFGVNFEYPDNVRVSFQSTQFDPGLGDVCERFFGTKGISESHYTGGVFIKGENAWDSGAARGTADEISKKDWASGAFKSALEDADPNKEKAFIESIQSGKLVNEAQAGAESALSAILGRTAAYTGEEVSWNKIVTSDERWDPMIDRAQFDR